MSGQSSDPDHAKMRNRVLTMISCFLGLKYHTYTSDNIKWHSNAMSTISICPLGKQIIVELPVKVIIDLQ
jgi:hypothetical protein